MDYAMWDRYTHFVRERHQVYRRRAAGEPGPWTEDPVLAGWPFCNDFRVLDAGSQYLLGTLLSEGDLPDRMMRAFLYRYNNAPGPWDYFIESTGETPRIDHLADGTLLDLWREYKATGGKIFRAAYQITSGTENGPGHDKMEWAVGLAGQAFLPDGGPSFQPFVGWSKYGDRYILLDLMMNLGDAEAIFSILTALPRCADFMGQQILTDLSYIPEVGISDSDFVRPGPGSKRGMKLLGTGRKAEEDLRFVTSQWWYVLPDPPLLDLPDGRKHELSVMDVQNTFCEFQKYNRRLDAPPRTYRPEHPNRRWSEPVLPAHW